MDVNNDKDKNYSFWKVGFGSASGSRNYPDTISKEDWKYLFKRKEVNMKKKKQCKHKWSISYIPDKFMDSNFKSTWGIPRLSSHVAICTKCLEKRYI